MNTFYSFINSFIRWIFLLGFILLNSFVQAQFINNKKGQIINDYDIFNPLTIKKIKIKTITVSYSLKKERQGIYKIDGKINHYLMDTSGRISRYYFTKNYHNSRKDTVVEWRYYKKNKLKTVKKSSSKIIKVKSYFYDDNLPSTLVYGVSNNKSSSIIDIDISDYKEEKAEYIDYQRLKNGDSIIRWMHTDKTVFKKLKAETIDSNKRKETITYPFMSHQYIVYTFDYKDENLVQLNHETAQFQDYYYTFTYNSNQDLVSFIKYSCKYQTEIEVSELIYDKNTGNLHAILTKSRIDNSIRIKKFKYTYYK